MTYALFKMNPPRRAKFLKASLEPIRTESSKQAVIAATSRVPCLDFDNVTLRNPPLMHN